jgi:hypothetical protein
MKKIFSASLIALLCGMTNNSLAQKDSLSYQAHTRSKHLDAAPPKFDIEEDIRLMTLLTEALEKDGLIDKKNPYKLEIKNGDFYINDKKQNKEVRDKYQKYFRKDKDDHYTIQNNGDRSASTANDDDLRKAQPKTGFRHADDTIKFDGVNYQKSLALMNQLITGLEKEGLLDSKKPYTLEVKVGELYINGNKQLKEVSDKFRKYFQSNNYALIND